MDEYCFFVVTYGVIYGLRYFNSRSITQINSRFAKETHKIDRFFLSIRRQKAKRKASSDERMTEICGKNLANSVILLVILKKN